MREIKFRAWDKELKRLITDTQEFIPCVVTNKGVLRLNPCRKEECWEFGTKDRFEIMQGTGIKDKNGKEIYESDIVGYEFLKAKIIYGFCGFEFEWIDGRTNKIRHRDIEPIFKNASIIFEVIGNIYENPELLEVINA